jgi:hypothetical protein
MLRKPSSSTAPSRALALLFGAFSAVILGAVPAMTQCPDEGCFAKKIRKAFGNSKEMCTFASAFYNKV